jgi:predicted  nucleic acid-binding Zn ribbon protein
MNTAAIFFSEAASIERGRAEEALQEYLGALLRNGQILGSTTPIARRSRGYALYVNIPDRTALLGAVTSRGLRHALRSVHDAGLRGPKVRQLGRDPDGLISCRCRRPSFFILFATFLHDEPPVRCGDCFSPVPLYRFPKTGHAGDYDDLVSWQRTYQAMDWLFIGSGPGERFGHDQMARWDSDLSKLGLETAKTLAKRVRRPVYYGLFKHYGRSDRQERARKCPSCGRSWLLSQPLHGLFDFQCKRCRLLGNVAWDVRRAPA